MHINIMNAIDLLSRAIKEAERDQIGDPHLNNVVSDVRSAKIELLTFLNESENIRE
jgi:hypothetical protein